MKRLLSLLSLLSLLAVAASAPAASVETFVLSVGGESRLIPPFGCSVFAAPAPVMNFFGAVPPGIPTEGLAACQVAGDFRHQLAAAGPIADATALNTSFNTGLAVPNTFQGAASAAAQSGVLAATAQARFTGPGNGFIVEGSNGFGKFNESFTLTSPSHVNGTAGMLVFGVSLVGAIQVANAAPAYAVGDVELRYQQDAGPIYNLLRAQHDGTTPFIATTTQVSNTIGDVVSGFTLGARSIAGAGQIETFALPFVFGTPFDFTLGLLGMSVPGPGGEAQSQFNTWVSRIAPSVGGVPVVDFSVFAASGTLYGAGGVLAVPELPSAWLLGLGALTLLLRGRAVAP